MLEEWFNISYFYEIFLGYWWNALYVVLYLGCLFYIVRKRDKIMMQIFAWPFLILLITVLNPLFMEPVLDKLGWRDRYSRFYWILPVTFLCAFFAAKLIAKQKRGQSAHLGFVFSLSFIFVRGKYLGGGSG